MSPEFLIIPDDSPPGVADRELVYNDAGRLYQLIDNGELKAEYIYNDQGLRSRKILHHSDGSTQTIIYHYTINNQLISETNQNGQLIRDYIWMEAGYPVAQIDHNNGTERLLYLHDDHLMTARLATDTNQNIVWHWDGDAFGGTEPVASGGVSVNMRFPGQYFDLESGLFYNWNRYYDPGLGRYVTSDPIGLDGGLNTYGYVKVNPLTQFDINGLFTNPDIYDFPPDLTPCLYYSSRCAETGCFYYCQTAPRICRYSQNIPLFIGISNNQFNCIRSCLAREDNKEHENRSECTGNDCLSDEVIDNYHDRCFEGCGVPSWRYPGVFPFNPPNW